MKNRFKGNSRNWLRQAFIRIILYAIGYTFLLCGLIVLPMMLASYISWDATSLIYRFLAGIERSLFFIIPFMLICGYLLIVYIELRKVYGYLDEIIEGVKKINDHSSDLISLEYSELKEISDLLNVTKLDIQQNAKAAKEAEQRKNDLVVYLAHDLKTPLTSIIGYLTLLRDEKNISEELRMRYTQITLEKAERLEDLINEFFDITRFNLTHQVLEISQVNLVRLLEQLTYEFKPMLAQKNLTCQLHMPKHLEIKCDVNKIQRVLDNLLRNAVNYSFENTNIDIDMIETKTTVEMTFQNHGYTIPQEKLNHLFEQFFRLDSSRTSKTGGSGLGLSIAKGIVEQHGGTIEAKSENEMIIFKVVLPKQ